MPSNDTAFANIWLLFVFILRSSPRVGETKNSRSRNQERKERRAIAPIESLQEATNRSVTSGDEAKSPARHAASRRPESTSARRIQFRRPSVEQPISVAIEHIASHLGGVLGRVVENHRNRSPSNFLGYPDCSAHDSVLLRIGAPAIPGGVKSWRESLLDR